MIVACAWLAACGYELDVDEEDFARVDQPLGAYCEDGDECRDSICAIVSTYEGFCTRFCDDTQPCPEGFVCWELDICVPGT